MKNWFCFYECVGMSAYVSIIRLRAKVYIYGCVIAWICRYLRYEYECVDCVSVFIVFESSYIFAINLLLDEG